MEQTHKILWWHDGVPDLKNWDRAHYALLSETDKAWIDNYALTSPFIGHSTSFYNTKFIANSTIIATKNSGHLKKIHGLSTPPRWIWLSSILAVITTLALIWFFKPIASKETAPYSIAKAETPKTEFKENITSLSDKKNESETSPNSNQNLNNNLSDSMTDQESNLAHTIETGEIKTGVVATSVIQKDEGDTLDNLTNTPAPTETRKKIKKTFKGTGFKFTGSTPIKKEPTRNADFPIEVQDVKVEQIQNYAAHLNHTSNKTSVQNGELSSNKTSNKKTFQFSPEDIPTFKGGNERLEALVKVSISQHSFEAHYDFSVSVMASFTVNPKGQIEHLNINGHETPEVFNAIKKALNDLSGWKKGKKSGKRGTAYYEILISFN